MAEEETAVHDTACCVVYWGRAGPVGHLLLLVIYSSMVVNLRKINHLVLHGALYPTLLRCSSCTCTRFLIVVLSFVHVHNIPHTTTPKDDHVCALLYYPTVFKFCMAVRSEIQPLKKFFADNFADGVLFWRLFVGLLRLTCQKTCWNLNALR